MNDTQKQRIAEFLNGIIDSSLPAEQQIMMFSEEEGIEGAGATNGVCKNSTVKSCNGSTNDECTNYDNNCDESNNVKCFAINGAVCESLDSSTASCGGKV